MSDSNVAGRSKRFKVAVLGATLTIAGPFLWAATVGVEVLWQTGLLMWIAMVLGASLGVMAIWRDRRVRTWIPAGFSIGMIVIALPGYFLFTSVPAAPEFADAATVPEFAIPNQDGNLVRLADVVSKRAALLVFYRGFW